MYRTLGILVLLMATETAFAAALQIWPVKVSLSPKHATESVRLTNTGDEPVNLQVSASAWDMDENGKFIETDTLDFVFFPRLLTVPPHQEKVVRVGYQGDFPPIEKSYRLIVEELPKVRTPDEPPAGKAVAGVSFIMRMSLPLFVMPGEAPPRPEITIDGVERVKQGFRIGIRAPGTHHIGFSKVEAALVGPTGDAVAEGDSGSRLRRVLPKRRIFVTVPIDTAACERARALRVKVDVDGLGAPYEQSVILTPANCRAPT